MGKEAKRDCKSKDHKKHKRSRSRSVSQEKFNNRITPSPAPEIAAISKEQAIINEYSILQSQQQQQQQQQNLLSQQLKLQQQSQVPEAAPVQVVEEPTEEQDQENNIMKLFGFNAFGSSKGKDHTASAAQGVFKATNAKRKYRQYMHRRGGFNRLLDQMD